MKQLEKQSFYEGKMFDAYRYMGAHTAKDGILFRTYAPSAKKISIVGDFTGWDEVFLEADGQSGFFTYLSKDAVPGQMYKYRIYGSDDVWVEHCDPYGFGMELRPGCCSIIAEIDAYKFHDDLWMKQRTVGLDKPVNIYEMHFGSWKRNSESEDGWFQYDEMADVLIPYLKEGSYTHVEFMPLSEHPFDGSWGYQNTGFFAPTSRYGTAKQLQHLIDKLHQAGIGAILDFVPVHFAIDAYGLKMYDSTPLYEYPHRDVGESEWGSYNFIHSRREVACFLQSAANYWLHEFHFDGLRFDAVSRLIYWQGDPGRGENDTALAFLKNMNAGLKQRHPSAMLIAEDSTSYSGVTKPVSEGGLGFDYKWDLGWMHDTLEYFQTGPEYRTRDYHKLTFGMSYFYSEQFMLEFSHDENVHGKATIIQKMYGDYADKFPQVRALYLYMLVHPGKKLNFMGNEIGQFREWDEKREQDWDILKYPLHDSLYRYMIELNRIYQKYDALHGDYRHDNFKWLDCHQEEKCIYALARYGRMDMLTAIFNFSNQEQEYTLQFDCPYQVKLLLHTDWERYSGTVPASDKGYVLEHANGKDSLRTRLPRYSGILLRMNRQ